MAAPSGEGMDAQTHNRLLMKFGWLGPVDRLLATVDPAPYPVELYEHPESMLRSDPQLWAVVDEWRAGYRREIADSELDELSGWHLEALAILRAADARSRERMPKAS